MKNFKTLVVAFLICMFYGANSFASLDPNDCRLDLEDASIQAIIYPVKNVKKANTVLIMNLSNKSYDLRSITITDESCKLVNSEDSDFTLKADGSRSVEFKCSKKLSGDVVFLTYLAETGTDGFATLACSSSVAQAGLSE